MAWAAPTLAWNRFTCSGTWMSKHSGITTASTQDGELYSDYGRFKVLLSQIVGRRLTYQQLIGKEAETAFEEAF